MPLFKTNIPKQTKRKTRTNFPVQLNKHIAKYSSVTKNKGNDPIFPLFTDAH